MSNPDLCRPFHSTEQYRDQRSPLSPTTITHTARLKSRPSITRTSVIRPLTAIPRVPPLLARHCIVPAYRAHIRRVVISTSLEPGTPSTPKPQQPLTLPLRRSKWFLVPNGSRTRECNPLPARVLQPVLNPTHGSPEQRTPASPQGCIALVHRGG